MATLSQALAQVTCAEADAYVKSDESEMVELFKKVMSQLKSIGCHKILSKEINCQNIDLKFKLPFLFNDYENCK